MNPYRYIYTWKSGDVDYSTYYHETDEDCVSHVKDHIKELDMCVSIIVDRMKHETLNVNGKPLVICSRKNNPDAVIVRLQS